MELRAVGRRGRIKYAVEVVDGLDAAPETLNRLFTGDHAGKLIVRVSEPAACPASTVAPSGTPCVRRRPPDRAARRSGR